MITKLVGIASLFAASSILVAGTPTLGARSLDNQISAATPQGGPDGERRCGGRRCGGRCGRHCAVPSCAVRSCAPRTCGTAQK